MDSNAVLERKPATTSSTRSTEVPQSKRKTWPSARRIRRRRSHEPLEHALRHFIAITAKYLPELLWWLGFSAAWALQAGRLTMFVIMLLPGMLPQGVRYCLSPHVWSTSYGDSVRHRLDVYEALGVDGTPIDRKGDDEGRAKVPIVVFVTGGAWIIGYRMWGMLMGFALQRRGIVCVCVDVRASHLLPPHSFPNGCLLSERDS